MTACNSFSFPVFFSFIPSFVYPSVYEAVYIKETELKILNRIVNVRFVSAQDQILHRHTFLLGLELGSTYTNFHYLKNVLNFHFFGKD